MKAMFFEFINKLKLKLFIKLGLKKIYYINSPQTLPPPLSKEREQELTEKLCDGDKKARDILVLF